MSDLIDKTNTTKWSDRLKTMVPESGRMIKEDGSIVNIAEILENIDTDSDRQIQDLTTILDAQDATGWGTTVDVSSYKDISLQFGTADSADLTVKIAVSLSETAPTFSSAASVSNHWDYTAAYDMKDASLISGDTGVVVSGTDVFKNLLVNLEFARFINLQVTARSAGSVTVKVVGVTN
jgi:hypothetical protein